MIAPRHLLADERANAAVEMALVLPLLLGIMMGAFELGNYFRSEHILLEGLRDGARYAARQSLSSYSTCTGAPAGTIEADTKNVVRTGQVSGGSDRLPYWTDAATTFSVSVSCSTTAGGQTLSGIYRDLNSSTGTPIGAPIVTVRAHLPYQSVLAKYGFTGIGMSINGSAQAAVMGM
jgi:Flp pilus assembly protein TadG